MFIFYYVVCIIYCFYQLVKKYKRVGADSIGTSPELDSIMVLVMAWILAPIDVIITWIRWVKEAEEHKAKNEKRVL